VGGGVAGRDSNAYRNATLALPVEGGHQLLLQRDIQLLLALAVVQLSSL
jgi:hypothetical protein